MINDNPLNTERTVRPQELQKELELQREDQHVEAAQQQQQQQRAAAGRLCPFCGAVNEPEALFCAQCGQPINKTTCPHCGAEIDPDADFCEVCHHYIKKDVCSFCGAHLSGNEAYCPECGSPRGGLVCPTCHSLNDFAFCKKCGTALTEEAKKMVKQLQRNPDYQELMEIVQDFSKLENALPYNSERDIVREQMNNKLRERVLTLLAKDAGVENPVIPRAESRRMTKEELEEQKSAAENKLKEVTGKESLAIRKGARLYDQIANNEAVANWLPEDYGAFIGYYEATHYDICGRSGNSTES